MGVGSGTGISTEAAEGEYVLSFGGLLRVVKQRLWIVLLVTAVLTGAIIGLSFAQTPTYEASIKILVGQESGITQDPNYVYGLQQLTQTMTQSVSSRPLAEAVIDKENLRVTPEKFLEKHLTVEQIPETQLIEVAYTDTDPRRAQRVANTVGNVFSEQVAEVSPSANAITATVWEPAAVPDKPVSPNPLLNALIALVVGLMLGVGLALLLEYLDDSWSSPEEVEQISGVPTYGVIPTIELPKAKKGRH
jgi:capsular polysaccharide biosynthesis protein